MTNLPPNHPTASSNALLVVAKRPAPGQTKTRLTPPLTPDQASALYECFLLDTLELMRQAPAVAPVIAYLPESEGEYFSRLAPDFGLLRQEGNDLGQRLDNALTHYLEMGFQKAVIMDSDSPTLPARYLSAAFAMLDDGADAVIGPCEDGGYYLIGLKHPCPRLLRQVRMSTSNVTADTLAVAAEENMQVGLLPPWYDVDDFISLQRLLEELRVTSPHTACHTRAYLGQLPLLGLSETAGRSRTPTSSGIG
jgi:hypothetical protein